MHLRVRPRQVLIQLFLLVVAQDLADLLVGLNALGPHLGQALFVRQAFVLREFLRDIMQLLEAGCDFGLLVAPLQWTLQTYLPADWIGSVLPSVIAAPTLPLTVGTTANELVKTVAGRLKRLVAVAAAVIPHRAAPDQDASRSL